MFKDLQFKEHPVLDGQIAKFYYPNGYGVSVVYGSEHLYCDENTYEVAIMKDGDLCYDTPLTDDVLSYQTKEDIDNIMEIISKYQVDEY